MLIISTVCNVPLLESRVVPTDIILTSIDTDPSNYNIAWMPLSNVRIIITAYPPESYTQEDLIIHNTDNSTVHNITVALNDCPHRIYSTFIFSKKYQLFTNYLNVIVTYTIISCDRL